MTKRSFTNLALLLVAIVSAGYLSIDFVSSYRQQLVEAKSQVAAPAVDEKLGQTEELLQEINFDVTEATGEQAETPDAPTAVAQVNRMRVSTMSVDAVINEGPTVKTLDKGIWHLPGTSTPDKGGNTVLAAHRWKWGPASGKSFYDIDKVKEGDIITMSWNGKDYRYRVTKISTVNPDQVEILNNSFEAKLTLFSCAPLFSSKYRIVVEAGLVNETT